MYNLFLYFFFNNTFFHDCCNLSVNVDDILSYILIYENFYLKKNTFHCKKFILDEILILNSYIYIYIYNISYDGTNSSYLETAILH